MKGFFPPLSLQEGEKNVSGIKVGFVSCLFVSFSLCLIRQLTKVSGIPKVT